MILTPFIIFLLVIEPKVRARESDLDRVPDIEIDEKQQKPEKKTFPNDEKQQKSEKESLSSNDGDLSKWPLDMSKVMTCEEFLINSTFDPFKVIDVDWRVWYIWSPSYEDPFNIKFSLPSKVLVDRFRVELDAEYKHKIKWDDSILFMETSVDFSGLFMKTEVDGLFDVMPSFAFIYYNTPVPKFALKIIDPPGYLAFVNCKYRIAFALAPADKVPPHDKIEKESKKIGFLSKYGLSHVHIKLPVHQKHKYVAQVHDDDDEDMHIEMMNQFNSELESRIL